MFRSGPNGAAQAVLAVMAITCAAAVTAEAGRTQRSTAAEPHPAARYTYSLHIDKAPTPAMSINNPVGKGHSPCNFTFNPAWIEPTPGTQGKSGLLVRAARCPEAYGGTGDHIMFAYCDADGQCGDLEPAVFPFELEAEDPRVVYEPSTGYYYLWYYASGAGESTVYTRRSKTPFDIHSWEPVGKVQPWHRNGCAFPERPDGRYIIFGEAPPLPSLGIARSTDNFETYTVLNDRDWLVHNPANDTREPEIVLEASTPVVQLQTGDYLHLYSAGTPGWVPKGNYTAGWIVMDRDDPVTILQRSAKHVLIASMDYEGVPPLNGFPVQRYRTTFVTSIVPIAKPADHDSAGGAGAGAAASASAPGGPIVEKYRLWWGAADANVATGILTVTATPVSGTRTRKP